MDTLDKYLLVLEGALGAITAHKMHSSNASSRVIRDLSKDLDNLSVNLRKELIEFDKSLTTKES